MMNQTVCLTEFYDPNCLNICSELRQDDIVLIRNCPPVSARKRFALQRVLKSPLAEREVARALFTEAATREATSTAQIA